jgi:hypothetical protein
MDEGRKRVLLIAASILAARKLAQYDKPCPAIEATIANSISMAEKIMRKIDAMFPKVTNRDGDSAALRTSASKAVETLSALSLEQLKHIADQFFPRSSPLSS